MTESLPLIGFASGIAANNVDCGLGPWYLYYHPELFEQKQLNVHWHEMIQTSASVRGEEAIPLVEENISDLGCAVLPLAWDRKPFCVIGGDHSSAIGTWSAVAHANREEGDIGLIWIDAHMDSHTPTTTHTHNIHGMPVSHLLGEGITNLTQLFDEQPKLKPQNVVIIGARSYEQEEAELLSRLGVKVILMSEVQERGLQTVMTEACAHVSQSTCGFGLSIDLDAMDPRDAPGVGCPESEGIDGAALVRVLEEVTSTHSLLGLEIAEYNPILDQEGKTAKLLIDILKAVYKS